MLILTTNYLWQKSCTIYNSEGTMKRRNRSAFTLLELLVGICVLVVLGAIGFILIRQAAQRTRVVVAKANLSQYAMLLESVKSEVRYYPPATNNTLESLASTASPPGYERWWRGPYLKETPVDPWKKEYFYHLVYGIIFGPIQCFRSNPPEYQDFTFDALPGDAAIVLDNFGLTACSVFLNGTEVITEDEFKMFEPYLEKPITLLRSNKLSVRARSNKASYIFLSITSPFSNRAGYIIGSYGSDNEAGGDGFLKDLTWESGQTEANF